MSLKLNGKYELRVGEIEETNTTDLKYHHQDNKIEVNEINEVDFANHMTQDQHGVVKVFEIIEE